MEKLENLHRAAGATFSESDGGRFVADYGDALGEYRALRESAGLVDRVDLALIRVWGRDPVRMINGLVTNDLSLLSPERSVYAAMLTPKGRMIADLRVVRSGGEESSDLILIVPRSAANAIREHLGKYVPPLFARWEEVTERYSVLGVIGPTAAATVAAVFGSPPLEDGEWAGTADRARETIIVAVDPFGTVPGYTLLVPAALAPETWQDLLAAEPDGRGSPVGFTALELLRVEAGVPKFGRDMSGETLPAEAYESTGLMSAAVSFTKGCYTGQEVVIRIAHRGKVNRHLRGLLLGPGVSTDTGTPLFHPETGREIGRTTSVVESPLLGQTIALGYVRREVGPGETVRVGSTDGTVATVSTLPFAMPARGRPREAEA